MYLGIDPGLAGGIVLINEDSKIVFSKKMPETLTDMNDLFTALSWSNPIKRCCIELVHALPYDTPKTAFTLGNNYGRLEVFMVVNQIPYETVSPVKWQNSFGLRKDKNEGVTPWKNRIRDLATRVYGLTSKEITLNVSDAAMIARYCWDKYNRQPALPFGDNWDAAST